MVIKSTLIANNSTGASAGPWTPSVSTMHSGGVSTT